MIVPLYDHDLDPEYRLAIAQIKTLTGDDVRVTTGALGLLKFGTATVSTANQTVATLGDGEVHETYVSDNLIDRISSESAADTQDVTVQGHTIADGVFTYVSQTVTLTGQTPVALPTPLARTQRAFVAETETTSLVGPVWVYQDGAVTGGKPTDDTTIHLSINAGNNQTRKAASTLSDGQYLIVTSVTATVLRAQAAAVDFAWEYRAPGSVFRTAFVYAVNSAGASYIVRPFRPFLIARPNGDIRVTASSSANNTPIAATYQGIYANAY